MASNAFLIAAGALSLLLRPVSYLLWPLSAAFALFERMWELWDWLLLSALCPPVAIFAAHGFHALPVLVSSYFYAHALFAWRHGVGPARAAALLASGGAAAALGVGSFVLGVPYTPRAMYCAAFMVAHLWVLAPSVGWPLAALIAAAPGWLLLRDMRGL